jgi:hypothetical protein
MQCTEKIISCSGLLSETKYFFSHKSSAFAAESNQLLVSGIIYLFYFGGT